MTYFSGILFPAECSTRGSTVVSPLRLSWTCSTSPSLVASIFTDEGVKTWAIRRENWLHIEAKYRTTALFSRFKKLSYGRQTYGIAADPGGGVSNGLVGGIVLRSPGLTVIPRGFNGINPPCNGSEGVRSAIGGFNWAS
jgi:hypothetical protein